MGKNLIFSHSEPHQYCHRSFLQFISANESVDCQFHIKLITAGTNHSCLSQLQYTSVILWNLERMF